tara:strand:+ start:692 stop:1120 length:429 start_codon:yes stop_codon:yes gene_type:complete
MRNDEVFVKRLTNEWIAHDKLIVAVDFDDTIFPWGLFSQEYCDELISFLKWIKTVGAYIVIFTASDKKRYKEIRDYCSDKGLPIDSINKNPIDLPYGKEGKIYYNIFLCDTAGLTASREILEKAAENYLDYKNLKSNLTDVA